MDYKELLKKYMNFVRQEKGIDFIDYGILPDFTSAELDELRRLANYFSVTLLDTITLKTTKVDDFTAFWWAEGNGECDCNRILFLELRDPGSTGCIGCRRVLITEWTGNNGGYTDFNDGYPKDLKQKYVKG